MDFDDFDEAVFNPEQTSLNRFYRAFGVLLLATFVLPIGRTLAASPQPINVWDQFGVASTLDVTRMMLPAVAGAVFIYLGFFGRLGVKLKSGVGAAALLVLVFAGVNPFEILRVVVPPVSGPLAEFKFGMMDGQYFPRENTLHLILLGAGLILLGAGGRYKSLLVRSKLGPYMMMASVVLISAYYLIPYDGKIAAARNVELYTDFHEFAGELVQTARDLEQEMGDVPPEFRREMSSAIKAGKMAGQLKLSAAYFLSIYFVPLLLCLFCIPSWFTSRFQGHRAIWARMCGWGASIYLLAFLFPLLAKESMRKTGEGFFPNLRSYIIFAAVFVGLTLTLSMFIKHLLEPELSDETLPADPLEWKELEN